MEVTVKLTSAAIVIVCLVFAAILAPYVDQTTFALLGGTFIGLLVGVPTVLLVALISRRRRRDRRDEVQHSTPTTHVHHTHAHTHEHVIVVVDAGASRYDKCQAIRALKPGITIKRAEQLLLEGRVQVVEQ
jgi:hypothetical protein